MLRVRSHRGFRISNRLAIVAALLLLASSAAGVFERQQDSNPVAAHETPVMSQSTEVQTSGNGLSVIKGAVRTAKGFKMSLFLFPRS